MTEYFWHRQPIEEHIDLHKFGGWFRTKTQETAVSMANDLLQKYKYTRDGAISQLSNALRRINAHQAIAICVFLTDFAAVLLAATDGNFAQELYHNKLARATFAVSFLGSGAYVALSDWRKYAYQQIKESLENRVS